MSAGKVSTRLPSLTLLRQGSTSGPPTSLSIDEGSTDSPHTLWDKDMNSINNEREDSVGEMSSSTTTVIERTGSGKRSSFRDSLRNRGSFKESKLGSGGGKSAKRDSAKGKDIMQEIPVYIGESNIILPASSSLQQRNSRAQNGEDLQYRKCCLFWTCCCKCSCLNSKQQDHLGKDSRLNSSNGEKESLPSIEEIRAWGQSFDRLMKCTVGRKIFHEFLICEYSEENILFWQACEDLKRETDPTAIEEKARSIFEDYISILSPKEVSLDSRVREIIKRNMITPSKYTFDEAQTQIYTLMHRDSYPRFVTSTHYKRLTQLNNNGSGDAGTTTSSPTAGGAAAGGGGAAGGSGVEDNRAQKPSEAIGVSS